MGEVDLKKYHCAGCGSRDSEGNLSFFVYSVKPDYPRGFYLHKNSPQCRFSAAVRLGVRFPVLDPVV